MCRATIITLSHHSFLSHYSSGDSDGKKSACNAGDLGLIPGLGISPGEGNGNPLRYSLPGEFHEQTMGLQIAGHD